MTYRNLPDHFQDYGQVMWVSREWLPIDRQDGGYHHVRRIAAKRCTRVDVGKKEHRACLVTNQGELVFNKPVENREGALDALLSELAPETLIVVDQVRNMGDLIIKRARKAGFEVAYLTGSAMSKASVLFLGEAKTDERDAEVIARTSIGIPLRQTKEPPAAPSCAEQLVLTNGTTKSPVYVRKPSTA